MMRQFTPWAHGAGGFLAHHGITGFLTNLNALRRMDEEDHKWAVFLAAWLDRLGPGLVKVADVLASGDPGRDHPAGPWDGDFITDDKGRYPRTPQKLGQLLAGQADRFHGEPPLTLRAVTEATTAPGCTGSSDGSHEPRKPRSTPADLRKQPDSNPAPNTRRYPQIPAVQPALRVSNTRNPRPLQGY